MSELLRLKKEFKRVREIYQKYLPTEEEEMKRCKLRHFLAPNIGNGDKYENIDCRR